MHISQDFVIDENDVPCGDILENMFIENIKLLNHIQNPIGARVSTQDYVSIYICKFILLNFKTLGTTIDATPRRMF